MATLTNETVASTYTYLLKMDGTSGVDGSLRRVQDGDATDSALSLSTAGIKSTGTLSVTGNTSLLGNVGCGVVSPTYALQVSTSDNEIAKFTSTDGEASIRIEDNSTSSFLGMSAIGDDLRLTNGGALRMIIKSDGKVGISTSGPASMLHIVSDSSTSTRGALTLQDSGQNNHNTGYMDFTPFVSDVVPASGYMDVSISNTAGWLFIATGNGGYGFFYLYMNGAGTLSYNQIMGAAVNEITISQTTPGDGLIRVTNGDSGNSNTFRGMFMGSLGNFRIQTIST